MERWYTMYENMFLRVWVMGIYNKDEWYPPAYRYLDLENRCVKIQHTDSIETLHINKTCMRNIEVAVMGEGKVYLI